MTDPKAPLPEFAAAVQRNLRYGLGKRWQDASPRDLFLAVSLATREPLIEQMLATEERYRAADAKRLYYLSVEFLMGRSLGNNLLNLGMLEPVRQTLASLGVDLETLRELEPDAALGNGGLGRLAACYLDSLASLDMPGFGYGINYEHGLFRQAIENGEQREHPDSWRAQGSPWLIEKRGETLRIPVYGSIEKLESGPDELRNTRWVNQRVLLGAPDDLPIVSYGGRTVNVLRLYSAQASDDFDIGIFHGGDYQRAFEQKLASERVSKVLYPPESTHAGKELRLLQEYFFVACALHDIVARYLTTRRGFESFPEKVAIQLNDTHPALAVAELVRIFIDEHGLPFERAFEIAQRTLAYTNHTLLPEALERWPKPLLAHVVPRHLQIIERINAQFLGEVEVRWPGNVEKLRRMSIIEEGYPQHVRMAHLAIVGSHAVNGVSRLHSELVRRTLVPDFAELWPGRFQNKTNGVSPRRWLMEANRGLADLITARIGEGWKSDLECLRELEPHADDAEFRRAFRDVKRANKARLSGVIAQSAGVALDPDVMFDVQVKRMHEYKRQLLAALRAIEMYLEIVDDGREPSAPRALIFAGKAAPEYFAAKLVIRLINDVAGVVNRDPRTRGKLRAVFVPDYRVSLAEKIIPAADLSEQISTAGQEASGTGNMKLALNGALTIGTLDGATIEMREAVGEDNLYIFGLRADEVAALRASGSYQPSELVAREPRIARVLEALRSGRFAPDDSQRHVPLVESLEREDRWLVLADFLSYGSCQEQVSRDWLERERWDRRAVLNVARMGYFSSDRAVREYATAIWNLKPVT
ncbi:MAG TPA: glycogen/starch/alpha-glucan phosphorylase [Myxococcota bacterium]|nr:glycogen/starch/alpha-glucan phosphorylase [Myxococcota bacterium]